LNIFSSQTVFGTVGKADIPAARSKVFLTKFQESQCRMVLKGAIAKLHDSIPPGFFYFSAEVASGFVAQTLPTLNVAEYLLSCPSSTVPILSLSKVSG
jgi:hypothetical protein